MRFRVVAFALVLVAHCGPARGNEPLPVNGPFDAVKRDVNQQFHELLQRIDGAARIYVADSRNCSKSGAKSGDSYLIADEALTRLRKALREVPTDRYGGCLGEEGALELFIVDRRGTVHKTSTACDQFLGGMQMTDEVRAAIDPHDPGFAGRPVGWLYRVCVSREVTEQELLRAASGTPYLVFPLAGARDKVLEARRKALDPYVLELKIEFERSLTPPGDRANSADDVANDERAHAQWEKAAIAAFEQWLDRYDVRKVLLRSDDLQLKGMSHEGGKSTAEYRRKFHFSSADPVSDGVAASLETKQAVEVSLAELKAPPPVEEVFPAFVIAPEPLSSLAMEALRKAIPALREVKPPCPMAGYL